MKIKHLNALAVLGFLACMACSRVSEGFSREELALLHGTDSIMRVLTIMDPADCLILRTPSCDLSNQALLSEDYATLCSLMVATVTHPLQDGVGIAGPQVGLNRRIVAVQRFDKEGEPFEVYPNIRIVWASDSKELGGEGCLSVPDRRGEVLRSSEIVIEHDVIKDDNSVETVRDTISGFTAVIFQHEVDHLDGILYIDRL